MSNRVVSLTFRHIIDDVIANVRQDFEDMGIEKEVLEELQRSWEAKLVATQVAEFEGAHNPTSVLGHTITTPYTPGAASSSSSAVRLAGRPAIKAEGTNASSHANAHTSDGNAADAKDDADAAAGTKRKRDGDDGDGDDDEIGSDLDDSDEEDAEGNEDMMLCLYDKVCVRRGRAAKRARGASAGMLTPGPTREEQVEMRPARRRRVGRRARLPLLEVQRVRGSQVHRSSRSEFEW